MKNYAPRLICIVTLLVLALVLLYCPASRVSWFSPTVSSARSPEMAGHSIQRWPATQVAFEPNLGQFEGEVKFASRGNGYNLFLTSNQAVVVMNSHPASHALLPKAGAQESRPTRVGIVRVGFVGASTQAKIEGDHLLPGKTNYFIGERKNWRSNVPQFGKVTYRRIYPGTDLVFYGNPQRLEMDFRLAPGATPQDIALSFQSDCAAEVNSQGDLVVSDSGQQLILRKPRAYQNGGGAHHEVTVSYRLMPKGYVGFSVVNYDPSRPLTIDPVVVFSTFLGGSGTDLIGAVAVDNSNSPYVFGATVSPNFPTTDVLQSTGIFFLTKFNPAGSAIVYSTLFGGGAVASSVSADEAVGLALDSSGNAYVAGSIDDSSYPTTTNAFQKALKGSSNAFVTKFNSTGSNMTYSTFIGGSGTDVVGGMALDPSGEVLLVGQTNSNDFPTMSAFQRTSSGGQDAFVTKLSADGSALAFSTYLGGGTAVPSTPPVSPTTNGSGIATDAAGDAFVTGSTYASDFPLKNPYSSTPLPLPNGFAIAVTTSYITEFTAKGALAYSTYFPKEVGAAIVLDSTGSFYVAGDMPSCAVAGQNCFQNWLTKFNAAGSTVIFSTTFGEMNNVATSTVTSMALDLANDVYVIGSCPSPCSTLALQSPISQVGDFYLTAFTSTGNSLLFSTFLPVAVSSCMSCIGVGARSVALDSGGNVYVAGSTGGTLPLVAPEQPAFGGGPARPEFPDTDGFLMKITNTNAPAAGLPGTVSFGVQPVGTSATQQTQISDLGSRDLTITSVRSNGDFSESDSCGGKVSAGSSCNISITFTPSAAGTRNGTVTITDNAAGSPQSFAVTGIGGVAQVRLTPASLTFPTQRAGTTSTAQSVQMMNTGQVALTINQIEAGSGFQETNDCDSSLAAGLTCSINVVFSPSSSASAAITSMLTITDSAPNSPQTVSLTGTVGSPTLGLVTSGSSSQTVPAGNTALYLVSIGGQGASGTATLSCSGAPMGAACSPPSSVSVSATTASTFTVNVTTTSRAAAVLQEIPKGSPIWAVALSFLGIVSRPRKPLKKRVILGFAGLIPLILSLCSCGGVGSSSNPNGTPAGSYTLTLTAASGANTQAIPLTLVVQ